MFSALRQNSELYMLDKSNTPTLKVGKVLMVKSGQPFYTNPLDSTVSITVSVDDENVEFKQIPSNLSIATIGNVVISETKELMNQEVDNMLKISKQVVESVPYHNDVIATCENMLKQLNPQLAKEKAQEEKISMLEMKMTGVEDTLSDIRAMLSKALNK